MEEKNLRDSMAYCPVGSGLIYVTDLTGFIVA